MYLKLLVFLFLTFITISKAIGTPDLIAEAKQVTYTMADDRILNLKLTDEYNLSELSYGNSSLGFLPHEVINKIWDVDIYSLILNSSLGIKGTDSWLTIDEKYVYLRFNNFVNNGNEHQGEYELKVTFLDCKFKSATVTDLKTNEILDIVKLNIN